MSRRRTALLPEENLRLEVFLELVRAYEALSDRCRERFKEGGVTGQQYNVLRILYVRDPGGDGLSCQQIGERLVHRVPDITRLVDRLAAAGWVERERSTEDRRVVLTRLTDAGFAKVEEVHPLLMEFHDQSMPQLNERDLAKLRRLLQKARASS